jgi:hypothetical protein
MNDAATVVGREASGDLDGVTDGDPQRQRPRADADRSVSPSNNSVAAYGVSATAPKRTGEARALHDNPPSAPAPASTGRHSTSRAGGHEVVAGNTVAYRLEALRVAFSANSYPHSPAR